jgi:RHS repeat-associated protein
MKNETGHWGINKGLSKLGKGDVVYTFGQMRYLTGNGNAEDGLYFYHGNHLSSTQVITNLFGNITQQVLYAPFGEVITEHNAYWHNGLLPDYMFNGKELDEESGMYYYEARYYNPPTFISRDPLFEMYPTISPYAYCNNNPVKYIDPDGRKIVPTNEGGNIAIKIFLSTFSEKTLNKAFGLSVGRRNGGIIYSSDHSNFRLSKQEFTKALGRNGKNMTESDRNGAYSFYKALQSNEIYEVEAWKPTTNHRGQGYNRVLTPDKRGNYSEQGTTVGYDKMEDFALPCDLYNNIFSRILPNGDKTGDFWQADNNFAYNEVFNQNRKEQGAIFGDGFNFYENLGLGTLKKSAGRIVIDARNEKFDLGKAFQLLLGD